ncbi:hypothetical protein M0R45_025009 [Rubus argutus]|uniref:mannose-6-phosphate isomerase n=1 Tax=Rubus argutus TaxID=59490 RepID=A0AAW1WUD8_RUBAR
MEKSSMKQRQQRSVQRLRCSVQNYDWGKRGPDSEVARLYASNSDSEIDPEKPYAEFWMGTHESGPSFLIHQDLNGLSSSLKHWVSTNPNQLLGHKVVQKWGSDLPFLFKVLSVRKALSIQAHPDKDLAKVLHKFMPNAYKDDNHKPEMALAMTHFEALCGFITLEELKGVLDNVPEIVQVVGSEVANQVFDTTHEDGGEKVKSVLRLIFTQLMSATKDLITTATTKLKNRLHLENRVRLLTEKEQLLNPGEALYLGANEPHAYIFGDCIECMATSDNVVRAGLTPKHRDVKTLCSMLTYKQGVPEILQGVALNPYVTRYLPPFDEFEVDRCHLPQGESVEFPAVPGPSIFVVTFGEGIIYTSNFTGDINITQGEVLFVPADAEITITSASELHIYRAGVNSMFFQAS